MRRSKENDTNMNASTQQSHDESIQGGGDVETGPRYVPPGDNRKEEYRLATFAKYPSLKDIEFWINAEAGFYYTGEKKNARCFSCGSVINCTEMDDPYKKCWHTEKCEMPNDPDNVPMKCLRKTVRNILIEWEKWCMHCEQENLRATVENASGARASAGIENDAEQPRCSRKRPGQKDMPGVHAPKTPAKEKNL